MHNINPSILLQLHNFPNGINQMSGYSFNLSDRKFTLIENRGRKACPARGDGDPIEHSEINPVARTAAGVLRMLQDACYSLAPYE